MIAKWILSFLLALSWTSACSQLTRETQTRVSLKVLPFVKTPGSGSVVNTGTCGVYHTPADRESGKLSLAIDCSAETHQIRSAFVKDKSAIKILHNDKAYTFLKEEVSGYRDCDGKEYHFFDGKRYELLNPGEAISLYRTFHWKGKRYTADFFFRTESSRIKPLTLRNLKAEFADEPVFLERLTRLAENDFQLVKYQYAINRVRMNALREAIPGPVTF